MRRVVSRGLLCVSGVFLSTLVACNLVLGTGDLTERTADGGSDTGSDGARDATLDAEGDAPRDANCDAGLDGRLDAPADVCLGDPCDGESGASGPGIQFVRGESQTQTTTPASVSFVQNEGDLLVAGVYWEKSATSVTVSDNLVDEWVSVAPEENSVALGTVVQLWYATAGKAGPNMVTVTPSSSTTMGLFVLEYSGVSGLDVSSANKSNPASAGDVMIAGTVTTTEPRDLIVALFADSQGGDMTVGLPFEPRGSDLSFSALIEDNVPAKTKKSTYAPTATLPSADAARNLDWAATVIAFTAK